MSNQSQTDYERIESAIHYILENYRQQPSLADVAASVHVSPYHFQRMFVAWAGVSPKKFIQYLSVEYAKGQLLERNTLLDTAQSLGMSGSSRLHDLFLTIEGMTPGDYKNGGESLTINYDLAESPFGTLILGSTPKGLCHMQFEEQSIDGIHYLRSRFPNAIYRQTRDSFQQAALNIFEHDWCHLETVKLHLAGTPFQLKVWESLLKIPLGRLASYGDIATAIGQPKASRAVGSAVGNNPVAYLIPCHRVIQASGKIGGYRWGRIRKASLIGWESAKQYHSPVD